MKIKKGYFTLGMPGIKPSFGVVLQLVTTLPKRFLVWGMKAIAGINAIKFAETVTSRSIAFELRRKKTEGKVDHLRYAEPLLFERLIGRLAWVAEDYSKKVRQARLAFLMHIVIVNRTIKSHCYRSHMLLTNSELTNSVQILLHSNVKQEPTELSF